MVRSERPIIPASLYSHCQGTKTLFDFSETEMFVCYWWYYGKICKHILRGRVWLTELINDPLAVCIHLFLWELLLEKKTRLWVSFQHHTCWETVVLFCMFMCFYLRLPFPRMPIIDTNSAGRGPASPSNGKRLCFLTSMINILSHFRQRLGRVNSL